ncbi:hypothetical protein [Halorubrum ezzemoulense]|uniref:hypothetical protein n=1 Tax=Halorubrum ezzemoulense TaxID=337243 RepID=UPI00232ABE9F|nr:hypothetical protein [Halorubrum ezzemoulense]MDB2239663.1 hypothetical protein [Halorubrum ezzemoulense]
MKTTAVGIGSAATIGGASKIGVSPVGSASAVAPLAVGAAGGAVALGYLMNEAIDAFTGSQKDYSGYTGIDALRKGIYEDAVEAASVDERVMTSIENNLLNSENVALSKGKAALVKALNEEKSQQDANTAMNEAINGYYATIQENILSHYTAQHEKFISMAKSLNSHGDFSPPSSFFLVNQGGGDGFDGIGRSEGVISSQGTESISLVDGSSKSVPDVTWISDNNYTNRVRFSVGKTDGSGNPIKEFKLTKPDGGTSGTTYGFGRIRDAFDKVVTKRDEVNSQLVGFASDLFSQYEPGDIPTDKVLDPVTAATELGNNTGLSFREAQAGMMGIPTSAGFSLRLELSDGDGSTYEVDAEIYTNAQPNDSDGNPAGFKVGNTYDPANFEAPIYVSYEYVDPETGERTSDFTQVENPFTVLEATDSEGNEVTEVTPTSKTQQTADISKLEEELASIREEQRRLLEKSQEPTGGAGGGFFGGGANGIQNLGLVAAGGALIALLLGNR